MIDLTINITKMSFFFILAYEVGNFVLIVQFFYNFEFFVKFGLYSACTDRSILFLFFGFWFFAFFFLTLWGFFRLFSLKLSVDCPKVQIQRGDERRLLQIVGFFELVLKLNFSKFGEYLFIIRKTVLFGL